MTGEVDKLISFASGSGETNARDSANSLDVDESRQGVN